jgi:hypothetical protein
MNTIKLTDEARKALQNADLSDGQINLGAPGSLNRQVYKEVVRVLEGAGYKWNRSMGRHYKLGGDAVKDVATILKEGGTENKRQKFQFFPTVPEVADQMAQELVDASTLAGHQLRTVLEPSVGLGALVKAIRTLRPDVYVVGVELNRELHIDKLPPDFVPNEIIYGDFMRWQDEHEPTMKSIGSRLFDGILMNPPFTKQQDIKHVMRAIAMLHPRGSLVTLMWPSWSTSTTKLAQAFRKQTDGCKEWTRLKPGEADGGLTKNAVDLVVITPWKIR